MAVGKLDGLIISVVFTYRGSRRQIITARRARKDEEKRYNDTYKGNDQPQD